MEEEKIKCIYYIKDLRTDKIIYIGQTTDFIRRKYNHFGHSTKPVDLYMFEEGRENFSMLPFEDIDCKDFLDEDLRKKEAELILQYDTINNGMNKVRSGLITKDVKKYKKDYYNDNKDNIIKNNINYYYENKENVLNRMKEYRSKEEVKLHKKEYQKLYAQTEEYKAKRKTEEYKKWKREYDRNYYKRKKQKIN